MMTRRERGSRYHANMVETIANEFPKLTDGQRRYIQNKVSQILRRCKCDVIQMWISNKPFSSCQYEQSYDFTVGANTKVYMNIQVD